MIFLYLCTRIKHLKTVPELCCSRNSKMGTTCSTVDDHTTNMFDAIPHEIGHPLGTEQLNSIWAYYGEEKSLPDPLKLCCGQPCSDSDSEALLLINHRRGWERDNGFTRAEGSHVRHVRCSPGEQPRHRFRPANMFNLTTSLFGAERRAGENEGGFPGER